MLMQQLILWEKTDMFEG